MEEIYFLTFREARIMLLSGGKVRVNLDLRKTNRSHAVLVKEDKVVFPDGSEVEKDIIKKIAKDENTVYFL
ncbi:MAG: Methyltransferase type 11, partial [Thermococcales archaeon 44_46]